MASTSAVSMAMPLARTSRSMQPSSTNSFFKPLPLRPSISLTMPKAVGKFEVRASLKEKAVTALTAAALTASMIVPDVADAATGSPSLKNFLLSIVAGGVVVAAIIGAIVGVANFDPVKRG